MDYTLYYVVFGIIFHGGMLAYWVISHSLRDPKKIYLEDPKTPSKPDSL